MLLVNLLDLLGGLQSSDYIQHCSPPMCQCPFSAGGRRHHNLPVEPTGFPLSASQDISQSGGAFENP